MNSKPKIPEAVIKRLPRYYRYLGDLLNMGISRVSSKDLSTRTGLTSSQVRQDFYCFGGFGIQGYGYDVEYLYNEIKTILGLDKTFKMVIVGAGNLGQALAKYMSGKRDSYQVLGLFDAKQEMVGRKIDKFEVQHVSQLEKFIRENEIDIAALTVPAPYARETAAALVSYGIKGIWNFAPTELKLPPHILLENIHMTDSLMVLGYRIANK